MELAQGIKLHQIKEDDLALLERAIPEVTDAMGVVSLSPRIRTQLRQIQRVLSNVRWNYGPPSEVKVIDAD